MAPGRMQQSSEPDTWLQPDPTYRRVVEAGDVTASGSLPVA